MCECSPKSNKSEPPTLCFRSSNDALDYAHHVVEDSNSRLAAQSLDALDRYVKGDVCLVLRAHFTRNSRYSDLMLLSIPTGVGRGEAAGKAVDVGMNSDLAPATWEWSRRLGNLCCSEEIELTEIERHQGAVFVGVTQAVQGPEGVIPSVVWLEAPKQRDDFRWQIIAGTPIVNVVVEIGEGVGGRKVSTRPLRLAGGDFAGGKGSGVSDLIEGGMKIAGRVKDDTWQVRWQPPLKDDLMNLMAGISGIALNPMGPWLITNKLVDFGIEIVDVMLCAQDGEARTLKEISHGSQIRPDGRP